MRIVFLSEEYPPETSWGGIASYVSTMAGALARVEGCDVHVLSCHGDREQSTHEVDGVTVHRAPVPRTGRVGARLAALAPHTEMRLRLAVAVLIALRRLELRPDVVEAPEWMAEALFVPLHTRAPRVVHLHASRQELSMRRGDPLTRDLRLASWLERQPVRRAALVTAPDVAQAPAAARPQVVRTAMPVVISAVDAPPTPAGPPVVGFVGRLDRLKAPEVLIRAAALLVDETPLRVVLVGRSNSTDAPDGSDVRAWLLELASSLGVPCEAVGHLRHDAVRSFYESCRVVAVPSRYERFSLAAAEAMAAGRPVVVTEGCGIASWLHELGPGWVVPIDDARALAAALRPHVLDEAHARAIGRRALTFARRHFEAEVVARDRLRLYRAVLEEAGTGRVA